MDVANNNNTLPMNYTMQVIPTYIEIEQKKLLNASLVGMDAPGAAAPEAALSASKSTTSGDNQSEFAGLMPAWMLAMGEAEYSQEQFNGGNGIMGQYLTHMAKITALQESFSSAISAIGSFGGLQAFLTDGNGSQVKYWEAEGGDVGAFVPGLAAQAASFAPVSNVTTMDAQELGILTEQSSVFQTEGSGTDTFDKELNTQGSGYLSDDSTIGDFISQISQDFAGLGANPSTT